jgi:hypothetical protein
VTLPIELLHGFRDNQSAAARRREVLCFHAASVHLTQPFGAKKIVIMFFST